VRHERVGIYLPLLKARIFDAVKAAGDIGISTEELRGTAWERPPKPETVKAHVWQLNSILEETDWRIVSRDRLWHLVREDRRWLDATDRMGQRPNPSVSARR
jgi:hypothetical protein